MFHAARSGKQLLAFECLENRRLLSADFGAAKSNVGLPELPPVSAIMIPALTSNAAGYADSFEYLPEFSSDNSVQLPPLLTTQIGEFVLDELETNDIWRDDLGPNREQTQVVSLEAIQFIQRSLINSQSSIAPNLIIELTALKAASSQQVVNVHIQDTDEIEVDNVEIALELRKPTATVEGTSTSANIVVAKPNHIVPGHAVTSHTAATYAANFAMPLVRSLAKMDVAVAPEQSLMSQPHRESLSKSTLVAENVNPIQLATKPSPSESVPSAVASEYFPDIDAPLGGETNPVAESLSGNRPLTGIPPIETPVALDSVPKFLTDVVTRLAPATGVLVSAGLSGDYEAIDLAMSQLLCDLDTVRADANFHIDESILRGLAGTAVVGAIAIEIARRRTREKGRLNRVTIEEHLAIWMYPECSGLSGGPTI